MSRLPRMLLATLALALLAGAGAVPAMADEIQLNSGGTIDLPPQDDTITPNVAVPNPTADYTSRTTLLNPVCAGACTPPASTVLSFQGGGFVATPSIPLQVAQVPTSWLTWGSPPFTEGATPQVYVSSAPSLTLNFNQVATIGGFELEPDPFQTLTYTVQFFNGATLIETVTQGVNGNAGARLFAIDNASGFNRIVVSGPAAFAIARVRAGVGEPIPEPATMLLLGTGLAGVGAALRKRRKKEE